MRRQLLAAALLLAAACRASSTTTGTGAMQSAAPATPARPAAVTPANVALGDSLFNNGSCQRCHGKGGVGAANGPKLDGATWVQLKSGSFEEIAHIITVGVPTDSIKDKTRRFAMRARGGPMNLTDPQIQAIASYVWTLTHK